LLVFVLIIKRNSSGGFQFGFNKMVGRKLTGSSNNFILIALILYQYVLFYPYLIMKKYEVCEIKRLLGKMLLSPERSLASGSKNKPRRLQHAFYSK